MKFPVDAFKIAAELIEQQLGQQPAPLPAAEPADLPDRQPLQRSVLSLLEGHNDRSTNKEQAYHILTHPRQQAWSS